MLLGMGDEISVRRRRDERRGERCPLRNSE